MGAGARASRTALKIRYKSSLHYLRTLIVVAKALATGGFVPKGLIGWLDNLSPNLEGRKESRGATEGAMEGCL